MGNTPTRSVARHFSFTPLDPRCAITNGFESGGRGSFTPLDGLTRQQSRSIFAASEVPGRGTGGMWPPHTEPPTKLPEHPKSGFFPVALHLRAATGGGQRTGPLITGPRCQLRRRHLPDEGFQACQRCSRVPGMLQLRFPAPSWGILEVLASILDWYRDASLCSITAAAGRLSLDCWLSTPGPEPQKAG